MFLGLHSRAGVWHWPPVAPFIQLFFQSVCVPLCFSSFFCFSFRCFFVFLFLLFFSFAVCFFCFCFPICWPFTRGFGPPRPASARRGRACVFFLLSCNSKLRPASPGFCSPGLSVFVSAAVLQFEVPLTAPGFCSLGLLCLLVVLLFRFCFAQFPIGLFLGDVGGGSVSVSGHCG